jgi:hypothetical protein
LKTLEEHLVPPTTVVLRGPADALPPWRAALEAGYRPRVVGLAIPAGVRDLPPTLAHPEPERVNAWICRGVKCLPPIDELERLPVLLDSDAAG